MLYRTLTSCCQRSDTQKKTQRGAAEPPATAPELQHDVQLAGYQTDCHETLHSRYLDYYSSAAAEISSKTRSMDVNSYSFVRKHAQTYTVVACLASVLVEPTE